MTSKALAVKTFALFSIVLTPSNWRFPRMLALRMAISVPLLAGILLGGANSAWGLSLEFDPVSQTVAVGDQAIVDIWARDLVNEQIGAFDVTVGFAPAILSAIGVQFYSSLGGISEVISDLIPFSDSVQVSEVSLLPQEDLALLQPGPDLMLFTLHFLASAPGISPFEFTNVVLSSPLGYALEPTLGGGSATVQPVFEPPTLILLGSGLVGLVAMRKKMGRKRV